jgi:hypothetical protein
MACGPRWQQRASTLIPHRSRRPPAVAPPLGPALKRLRSAFVHMAAAA